MTGPEHYREAERLLALAASADGGSNNERYNVAAAQVHATLATAAATMAGAFADDMEHRDYADWFRTISSRPGAEVVDDGDLDGDDEAALDATAGAGEPR